MSTKEQILTVHEDRRPVPTRRFYEKVCAPFSFHLDSLPEMK